MREVLADVNSPCKPLYIKPSGGNAPIMILAYMNLLEWLKKYPITNN